MKKLYFGMLMAVLAGAFSAAHGQSFLTNGLVSYYPFNGNANDTIGTNNGTPVGATLTSDRFGKANSAYDFGGSSWIETPQYRLLDGASNATISAWVMINSGTSGQLLSSSDSRSGYDPISVYLAPEATVGAWFENCVLGNSVQTVIGNSPGQTHELTNLTAGAWHQVDIVLSTSDPRGTFAIYVDGVTNYFQTGSDDGTTAFTNISYDRDMRFLIGAVEGRPETTPAEFWSGKIDDVRIYNRALSPLEVQQLYSYESALSLTIKTAVEIDWGTISNKVYQVQTSVVGPFEF